MTILEPKRPDAPRPNAHNFRYVCELLLARPTEVWTLELATKAADEFSTLTTDERGEVYQWLRNDVEDSGRQLLFKRLKTATRGPSTLVTMRADTMAPDVRKEFKDVNKDLDHALRSTFTPESLVLVRLDETTSAPMREKLERYEQAQKIRGAEDLSHRLGGDNRLCYAFFHPALPDEPIIFVYVALTNGLATSIDHVLRTDSEREANPDTATFYGISNCQKGLLGIVSGEQLIINVALKVDAEHPEITQFATLSPMSGFAKWLDGQPVRDKGSTASADEQLLQDAAEYLAATKRADGEPLDNVARFHVPNGAVLVQINSGADMSDDGIEKSRGVMANYLYDLAQVVQRQEQYAATQTVPISDAVAKLLNARRELDNENPSTISNSMPALWASSQVDNNELGISL